MQSDGFNPMRRSCLRPSAAEAVEALNDAAPIEEKEIHREKDAERYIYNQTTCSGGCGMRACIANGEIRSVMLSSDNSAEGRKPRGCPKGIGFPYMLSGTQRLKGPMIRRGAPGTSDFQEVDWNEALDYAASELRRISDKYGPQSVGVIFKADSGGYVHKGALARLSALNQWTIHGGYDMNGALPMSFPMTFGVSSEESDSACWPAAGCIMVFGSNLAPACIPDTRFIEEAKEAGSKILAFDPNFSPIASESDEWYSIRVASDAAVALGMVKVLIDEELYDADFVKTYTDLPLLIRRDNGKKLKARDVAGLTVPPNMPSYREAYVAYNGSFLTVDPECLNLPDDLMLEGEFAVSLKSGETVPVVPAFQLLRELVAEYTPRHVERLTNMPGDALVRIAREIASAKPLHVIFGTTSFQWYHGDLSGRAISLLPALTGNIGHRGDGISAFAGLYRLHFDVSSWWRPEEFSPNWLPFEYLVHGPTEDMSADYPPNGIKALIIGWSNPFDQHNLMNKLRDSVETGELELVINLDFQMTTTGKYSHVLLPGVSSYEKTELLVTPIHLQLQLMQPVIEPVGGCKPEFWIFRELARRISPGQERYFYPELTAEKAAEEVISLLLKNGGRAVAGITLESLQQKPAKIHGVHPGGERIPFYEQIHKKKPFPPASHSEPIERTARFVKSGRIEFYKDEEIFLRLSEQLPIYKPPYEESEYVLDPTARRRFPFSYISRSSVYRIHSTYQSSTVLRDFHDDRAKVWLSPEDAAEKAIASGDQVEVFNDRGTLLADAVVDPGIHPKTVVVEGAWWSRYTKGSAYCSLIYPFIKPTHEVYFVPQMWSPSTPWNECLCDVRKINGT